MKTTFLTLVLLFLTGCGEPQTITQPDIPVQQPADVTTPPVTPEQATAGFAGKVIKVVDGDTIDVLTDDMETIWIRFSGVDTPERGQPFGNNATQMVKELVAGEIVRIVSQGDDRYDRTVGDIYRDDTLINLSLVKAGLAWHYVKYAPDNTALREAEQRARGVTLQAEKVPLCGFLNHNATFTKLPPPSSSDARTAPTPLIFSCCGTRQGLRSAFP